MAIRRVWIEEGCIACNLCEDVAPEVFEVPAGENCRTKADYLARLVDPELVPRVLEARDECPVEVIQLEED